MTYEMCKTLSRQNTEIKMPDNLIIHTNICNKIHTITCRTTYGHGNIIIVKSTNIRTFVDCCLLGCDTM